MSVVFEEQEMERVMSMAQQKSRSIKEQAEREEQEFQGKKFEGKHEDKGNIETIRKQDQNSAKLILP